MEKKPYRKSGLGERGLFPLIFAHAKVAKVGKGVVPRLRDADAEGGDDVGLVF